MSEAKTPALTPEWRARLREKALKRGADGYAFYELHTDWLVALLDENERLRDGMELAWGVIANAHGGDWILASANWRRAAEKWRDEHWHRWTAAAGSDSVKGAR